MKQSSRLALRFLALTVVITAMSSCMAPQLAPKPDRALIRSGVGYPALMMTSKPLARDPATTNAEKITHLLTNDANLFKPQIYAQPGTQDLVFCIRAEYSAGLGTITKNDKFAHLRADLKAGHIYEVRVTSERDKTKSFWWSPQDELQIVTYEFADQGTGQLLGKVRGQLLNEPEAIVEFLSRSGMISMIAANKTVKR